MGKKLEKNALAKLTLASSCQIDLGSEITSVDNSNYSDNIVWGVQHTNSLLDNEEFTKQKYNVTDANGLELRDSTSKPNEYKIVNVDSSWSFEKSTLIIPSWIDNTVIDTLSHSDIDNLDNSFNTITDIIIPKSITNVSGQYHFSKYKNLKNVDLGCIALVGGCMFMYCSALEKIIFPRNIINIAHNAFNSCESLSEVNIPDSVSTIGISAFYNCKKIKNIKLSSNLITINRNAFGYCTALQSITIPEKVTTIGENTFIGCSSLATITINNVEGAIAGADTAWGCPNVNVQIIYTKE